MTEIIAGGIFTLIATGIGAFVAWRQAQLAHAAATEATSAANREATERMLKEYREALTESQKREQLHFMYNRQLVDHIYKGLPPPPPPAPDGLLN